MDIDKLLLAWNNAFGSRPVLAAALHWQASNGHVELAAALGQPLPSVKSLGRLLASHAGKAINGRSLVRCPGRIGNGVLWTLSTQDGDPSANLLKRHEDGSPPAQQDAFKRKS